MKLAGVFWFVGVFFFFPFRACFFQGFTPFLVANFGARFLPLVWGGPPNCRTVRASGPPLCSPTPRNCRKKSPWMKQKQKSAEMPCNVVYFSSMFATDVVLWRALFLFFPLGCLKMQCFLGTSRDHASPSNRFLLPKTLLYDDDPDDGDAGDADDDDGKESLRTTMTTTKKEE